ncbi:uncharacterized protein PADG_11349 [Paracoccidioides brasiliensis Pb18]|uniref:Uncharacterized protein n=2 Tax=Paracoccidioides brasiliensis TaxID=121759 RepID=A0A0A0HV91_PARBD|nr:uncharacterized protein PADG_11349 [Paracoccidioides brasiliensis Pb18]KGM92522.1 hypothetical protein PADG_11349 [Paracoccidioides brasiliensis Pb18]ODH13572.1 hypothetical protein ACO22_07122 [Paracoccidioides brasiliensis]ODH53011.1 hypothetical protein GX48_00880 [Paracoccidioides brasiliensis]
MGWKIKPKTTLECQITICGLTLTNGQGSVVKNFAIIVVPGNEDVKLKSHSTIPQQYQQEKVPLFYPNGSTLPEAPMQLLQVQTSTA